MTNLEKIVHEWCTAASPFQTEISGRMWTPIAPQDFKNDSGSGSIVYHRQTLKTHVSGAIHFPIYVFKCYGGIGSDEANAASAAADVGRLLYDRIHGARGTTTSGRMITAEVAGGGGIGKEPDTGFWVDISSYQILIEG